jgi:hypothetical protein
MGASSFRAGLYSAAILAGSLLSSPVAVAADVSGGTALRHSGQIHTHRGHHAKNKPAADATRAPGATGGGASQPSSDTSTR